MLIAHAPAGYLLTRVLSRTVFKDWVQPSRSDRLYQLIMFAGIFGGILPDFDFIYQNFIDSVRTPHHSYVTHMPIFWVGVLGVLFLVGKRLNNRRFIVVSTTLCLSALLHLVFDTLTGVIYWFYPLSGKGLNIFAVSDVHIWWVRNYMYHWTFLVEIAIIITAMAIFLRVKETFAYVIDHFGQHATLRAITIRVGVCIIGLVIIVLVGSMQFNIDNRIVKKVIELKHRVVRMALAS